jgi:hypothetical protein
VPHRASTAGHQPPRSNRDERPTVTAAYFYRIKWGSVDEWLELYERNHRSSGRRSSQGGSSRRGRSRRASMATAGPTGPWSPSSRDWAAMEAHAEREIAGRLYPDQAAFRAEERRRFELLEAHWDVPLER